MRRKLLAGLFCGALLRAQEAPRFDVASVKLMTGRCSAERPCTDEIHTTPTSLSTHGCFPGILIRWIYGKRLDESNETIGPDWLEPGGDFVRYDIAAKTDHEVSVADLRKMLLALLVERLKLALHTETRETRVYVLSVGKGPLKITPSQDEGEPDVKLPGGWGIWRFKRMEFSRLHEFLYQFMPPLIVDETGIQGRYDFELDVVEPVHADPVPPHTRIDMGPQFDQAFRRIGLKLEPARRPVEVLAIDHIEKTPTPN
ncbi:MAG TPA: TIGR03435 family protein [Bryobacteraceae bacterium]|nr:TIGR03435 family protein [Bryobacteraceae bacterium]